MPSAHVSSFLAKFDKVKSTGGQWLVCCPGHADKTPSLAVKEGTDGSILLRCHGGCDTDRILAAMSLDASALFEQKSETRRTVVKEYAYHDEDGKLLFQCVRYSPKGFSQRQPDGTGGWAYNLQGVRRVLYRLPELLGQKAILFVEGEKDADRAWALGLPTTCNPMGAGKWDGSYVEQLQRQGVIKVAIVPDHDAVGLTHAAHVAASLQYAGLEVRVVDLPGLADHGDLSDFLAGGKTKDDVLALVKATPVWVKPAAVRVEAPPKVFTELGDQRYSFAINPEGIVLEVNRLRRSSQELVGELVVRVNGQFPHAKTFSDGILTVGDLNFSSVQARGTRAKLLGERAGDKTFDWYGCLEEFVASVISSERRGAPAEVLADVATDDEDNESWTVEGFPLLQQLPQIIFGDAASGKSYFAMWLAGKLANAGVAVLYADWEFSKGEHKKRLQRLFQPMPRNLMYIRCEHSLKHETDHLLDVIQKNGIQYIVCDSIGFAVDGPAESQEGAAGYFRYLRSLRVGSLNVAHIPKQYDDNREAQVFGCYSDDTEVLTDNGWKKHADLIDSDEVLAWDSRTASYRWERPTAVHVYDYQGDMIHLRSSTTDALVTPNHRCVVRAPAYKTGSRRKVPAGEWRFIEAKDLPRQVEVPLSADFYEPYADAEIEGGDDWLRLIGWWVSEGSNHGEHSFSLAQATDSYLTPMMLSVLHRLGIEFTKTISRFKARAHEKEMCYITSKRSAKAIAVWLRNNCGEDGASTKRLPGLTWGLSKRQKHVLLEALIDGDGSRFGYGGSAYHTVSRQLADDVQRLAIECGHAASIRFDLPGKVWHHVRCIVRISREKRRTLSLYARHSTRVSYTGKVYCLTVPSGAYVTRRNGKMAIYGNSVFFKAGARSIWFIDRAKENPPGELRFGLYHRKSNVGSLLQPRGYKLAFRGDKTLIESVDLQTVDELSAGYPLLDRLKRALITGPMSMKGLSEELDANMGSVRSTLSRHKSQFVKVGNRIGLATQRIPDNAAEF